MPQEAKSFKGRQTAPEFGLKISLWLLGGTYKFTNLYTNTYVNAF